MTNIIAIIKSIRTCRTGRFMPLNVQRVGARWQWNPHEDAGWQEYSSAYELIRSHRALLQDRMSRRYPMRLDVYFRSHAAARRFGKQKLRVAVVP